MLGRYVGGEPTSRVVRVESDGIEGRRGGSGRIGGSRGSLGDPLDLPPLSPPHTQRAKMGGRLVTGLTSYELK